MTIDQFRKAYPFIPYGEEYKRWQYNAKWYKWLLDRIMSESSAEYTDHDWVKLAFSFQFELKERNGLFRKLPKPTKEQMYPDTDDIDPFSVGEWPEEAMPDIREFAKAEEGCGKTAERVAAILTKNDYCVHVLGQKTYTPVKEKYGKKLKGSA